MMGTFVGVSVNMLAETIQKVSIAGETIDKNVASLSFDGDNVVISFDDGNSQTVDMGDLSISLTYSDLSGISQINSDKDNADGKVYNLAGQYVGNDTKALNKGIYIVNGKKIVVR